MDGVVVDLLNAKWNTFVKKKFYSQFFTFAFYFLISLTCFISRPGPLISKSSSPSVNGTAHKMVNKSLRADILNFTLNVNESLKLENITNLFHVPSSKLSFAKVVFFY